MFLRLLLLMLVQLLSVADSDEIEFLFEFIERGLHFNLAGFVCLEGVSKFSGL